MEDVTYTLEFEKPLRELEKQLITLNQVSQESKVDVTNEIEAIEAKIEEMKREIYSNLTAWQRVQLSRHPKRPYSLDYIGLIFTDFEELHGDRRFREDAAIVGGPAFLNGQPVMVLGQQKGRNTRDNLKRNFGCPHPEGYRKAMRLMEMAEKFDMPIVTLIDTPGAYPGIGAEERHVAEAIAVNIRDMSALKVPIVTIVIGEGGSGGALGMAVADEVMILENGYYSVISPEGCAAILWKDRAAAPEAADALKFSPEYLEKFGVVDRIVKEPMGVPIEITMLLRRPSRRRSSIRLESLKRRVRRNFLRTDTRNSAILVSLPIKRRPKKPQMPNFFGGDFTVPAFQPSLFRDVRCTHLHCK